MDGKSNGITHAPSLTSFLKYSGMPMSDLSALHAMPGAGLPVTMDRDTLKALSAHSIYAGMTLNWQRAVANLTVVTTEDSKAVLAHRRVLDDPRSQQALAIIWKESSFVDEGSLAALGLKKAFGAGELTCWGLAVASCAVPSEVGKAHKRLQKIVKAARCFGLVECAEATANRHPMGGTEQLHELMISLPKPPARQAVDVCEEVEA